MFSLGAPYLSPLEPGARLVAGEPGDCPVLLAVLGLQTYMVPRFYVDDKMKPSCSCGSILTPEPSLQALLSILGRSLLLFCLRLSQT